MIPVGAVPVQGQFSAEGSLSVQPQTRLGSIIWDGVLLAILAMVCGAFAVTGNGSIRLVLAPVGMFVLFTAAVDVALRVGQANLAVGATAGTVSLIVAMNQSPAGLGLVAAFAAVIAVGAVCAVLVSGLRVPMWAISVAMLIAHSALATTSMGSQSRRLNAESDLFATGPAPLAIGIVLTLIVGIVSMVRPADSSSGQTTSATVFTGLAVFASFVLAGIAGVVLLYRTGGSNPGIDTGPYMLIGVAAALVGGTSFSGRRSGIIGPLCAAMTLGVLNIWMLRSRIDTAWFLALAGVLTLGALIIHGALDRFHSSPTSGRTSASATTI
jgi:ribose transport system permease protein